VTDREELESVVMMMGHDMAFRGLFPFSIVLNEFESSVGVHHGSEYYCGMFLIGLHCR
jgi:hypothetical protein